MYGKPLILHRDGKIYIFPEKVCISKEELEEVEFRLKQYTTCIYYDEKLRIYHFDDYSIWSIILMGEELIHEFMDFLRTRSVNEFPLEVFNHIKHIIENFKQVLLEEDLEFITIKVLKGDIDDLTKRILGKYINYDSTNSRFVGKKHDALKIKETLLKNKVNIKIDNYAEPEVNNTLDFKCRFTLRSYEVEAIKSITNKSQKSGIIFMPPGSGKSYVALKLIENYNIPTLILCDNSQEYWQSFILNNTDFNDKWIGTSEDINNFKPITICSYQKAKDTILDKLKRINWGIIIYDDAHRTPAKTYSETLYLKSKYKFALAATLARSDGKEVYLYDVIGPKIYNIKWQELKYRGYYKNVIYYKVKTREQDIIKVTETLLENNKELNVLICSYNLRPNEIISSKYNIINIYGKGTNKLKRQQEHAIVENFNKGKIHKLCVSEILQRLQITNVDVLIAVNHNGSSKTEEIFRVGRAASCLEFMNKTKTTKIYSLVTDKDEKSFVKRLEEILRNGYKYIEIEDKSLGEEEVK
jgi:DNA excision repair protein ERCC-3